MTTPPPPNETVMQVLDTCLAVLDAERDEARKLKLRHYHLAIQKLQVAMEDFQHHWSVMPREPRSR